MDAPFVQMLSAPFLLAGPSPLVCRRDQSWGHFSLYCMSVTFRRSFRRHRVPCLLMTAYCIIPPVLLLPRIPPSLPKPVALSRKMPQRSSLGPISGTLFSTRRSRRTWSSVAPQFTPLPPLLFMIFLCPMLHAHAILVYWSLPPLNGLHMWSLFYLVYAGRLLF